MENYKFTINGNKYTVGISDIEDNKVVVEVNGSEFTVEMDTPIKEQRPVSKTVVKMAVPETPTAPKQAPVSVSESQATPSAESVIKSPLPGVILDVFVKQGDTVKIGQHVLLLEAMKMENNIDADKEGVVKELRVQRGDSIMEGSVLLIIE